MYKGGYLCSKFVNLFFKLLRLFLWYWGYSGRAVVLLLGTLVTALAQARSPCSLHLLLLEAVFRFGLVDLLETDGAKVDF